MKFKILISSARRSTQHPNVCVRRCNLSALHVTTLFLGHELINACNTGKLHQKRRCRQCRRCFSAL